MMRKICSRAFMVAAALALVPAAPVGVIAEENNFTTFRVLKPGLAIKAAQGALTECRKRGFTRSR